MEVDKLVEDIEMLSLNISKINFELDGLKEENDLMKEKRPFMTRQIQLNDRKMFRMSRILVQKMEEKHNLDAKLGAYKNAKNNNNKDKV